MATRFLCFFPTAAAVSAAVPLLLSAQDGATPKSADSAIAFTKFAGSDLIKHPTGITFTREGKLLAVESHTHFKPKGYTGPETDRIWWIER